MVIKQSCLIKCYLHYTVSIALSIKDTWDFKTEYWVYIKLCKIYLHSTLKQLKKLKVLQCCCHDSVFSKFSNVKGSLVFTACKEKCQTINHMKYIISLLSYWFNIYMQQWGTFLKTNMTITTFRPICQI